MDGTSNNDVAPLLQRIRHMWQFANLCQWIYIFGKAAKIDESLEIEEIEHECMKPTSTILKDIGLALLKLVSSHKGLTLDIFDEQLRKQYLAKAPEINPLGDGETISHTFEDLDVFSKISVLQHLTQWIMIFPDRLREKMDEQKDTDQTSWRIEPYGWDADDRTYYVLDDNRVYRVSEPPAPPITTKPKPKPKRTYGSSRRSSKRHRDRDSLDTAGDPETIPDTNETELQGSEYGGLRWKCVAVTLEDVQQLIKSMRKTRDGNEKILRDQLEVHLLPILEKQEESRKRKQEKYEREMLNLAKMANAKRSSRIAHKVEQQKQDEKHKEETEKILREAEEERRVEYERLKLERERDFRMFSREKRLKEREHRRRLYQDELSQLSEDGKPGTDSTSRVSERRLQLEIERNKQALRDLDDEEEDWIFDCVCGLYGQVDDGAHSIACERCNVWQHSKCVNIDEVEADRPDFHFTCKSCKRRIEEANTPRKTIRLKIKGPSEMAASKQKMVQSKDYPSSPIAVTETVQMAHRGASSQHDPYSTNCQTTAAGISPGLKECSEMANTQHKQTMASNKPDSVSSYVDLQDMQPVTSVPLVSGTSSIMPDNASLESTERRAATSKTTDVQCGDRSLAGPQISFPGVASAERNSSELGAGSNQLATETTQIWKSPHNPHKPLSSGLDPNDSRQPPYNSAGPEAQGLRSGHEEPAEQVFKGPDSALRPLNQHDDAPYPTSQFPVHQHPPHQPPTTLTLGPPPSHTSHHPPNPVPNSFYANGSTGNSEVPSVTNNLKHRRAGPNGNDVSQH